MRMRGSQSWRSSRARVLRAQQIPAEARLWTKLRGRRFAGHKFIRQAPIGPYFVDFLCRELKVVVEIDGATHGNDVEVRRDAERTEALRNCGYRIFRASNIDVYENMEGVLESLLHFTDTTAD
jgi:very-short-patch-repair endonuclease